MNKPIMFTPSEVFTMIVAICGAIVTISAAISVIVKAFSKAKEPEIMQNKRLANCENDILAIYKKFAEYDLYLRRDKHRLDRLDGSNEVTSEALLALLSHAINGNDIDCLKAAKKKLQDHLIARANMNTSSFEGEDKL